MQLIISYFSSLNYYGIFISENVLTFVLFCFLITKQFFLNASNGASKREMKGMLPYLKVIAKVGISNLWKYYVISSVLRGT